MDSYQHPSHSYARSPVQRLCPPNPHQKPRGYNGATPYFDWASVLDVGQSSPNKMDYVRGMQPSVVSPWVTGGSIAGPYIIMGSDAPKGADFPFAGPCPVMQLVQSPTGEFFPQHCQPTHPRVPESLSTSMTGNANQPVLITDGPGYQASLIYPQNNMCQQRRPTDPRHPYAFRSLPAYHKEMNRYKLFECFRDCRKRRLELNGFSRRANILAHLRQVHAQDIPRGARA